MLAKVSSFGKCSPNEPVNPSGPGVTERFRDLITLSSSSSVKVASRDYTLEDVKEGSGREDSQSFEAWVWKEGLWER